MSDNTRSSMPQDANTPREETETGNGTGSGTGAETVSYALYLHRQELGRPKRRLMRIAGTKLHLTNELILQQQQRLIHQQWAANSPAELVYHQRSALNRESMYRDRLWRNMQRQLEKQQHRQRSNLQQMGKL